MRRPTAVAASSCARPDVARHGVSPIAAPSPQVCGSDVTGIRISVEPFSLGQRTAGDTGTRRAPAPLSASRRRPARPAPVRAPEPWSSMRDTKRHGPSAWPPLSMSTSPHVRCSLHKAQSLRSGHERANRQQPQPQHLARPAQSRFQIEHSRRADGLPSDQRTEGAGDTIATATTCWLGSTMLRAANGRHATPQIAQNALTHPSRVKAHAQGTRPHRTVRACATGGTPLPPLDRPCQCHEAPLLRSSAAR